jgi:hypothetical protein
MSKAVRCDHCGEEFDRAMGKKYGKRFLCGYCDAVAPYHALPEERWPIGGDSGRLTHPAPTLDESSRADGIVGVARKLGVPTDDVADFFPDDESSKWSKLNEPDICAY